MAYTQQQVDDLEKAIAQGALRVRYNDKEIIYRSLEEMRAILNEMKNALGINKKGKSSILGIKTYLYTDKGL